MSLWTKRGVDIFAPTDAAGNLRKVINGEVQVWSREVEGAIDAAIASGALVFATKAELDADLNHDAGTGAWVVGDTDALNGIYTKSGASGAGSWSRVSDLPSGPQGDIGGIAFSFDDGTADANPGAGNIRANNADLSAATMLFVSKANRYANSVAAYLATLDDSTSSHKGYLILTAPDSETQATFSITGLTDASSYVKLTVSGHSGAASFVDAERLVFQFSRTGNAGDLNGVTPGPAGLELLEAETAKAVREIIRVAVQPEGFGATYDGSDDAAAIEAAAAVAVAQERPLLFSPGRTYTVSQITLPDGLNIIAKGATIRASGGLSGFSVRDIIIGANSSIDELSLTRPATGTNEYWVEIGEGTSIGLLAQTADSQWDKNGVITTGEDVHIGVYDVKNVERAFDAVGTSSVTRSTGFHLGMFRARSYRRGLLLSAQENFHVGNVFATERSPTIVAPGAGMNAILLAGSARGHVGDCFISNSGEHSIRVGGHPDFNTEDVSIGDVYTSASGGCPVKIAPTGSTNFGLARAKRIKIGTIHGVDVGEGPTGNNQEPLRASHAEDIYVEGIVGPVRDYPESGQFAIALNNCSNIRIGSLRGKFNAGISINETNDVDGVNTFGGDVNNVYIGEYSGSIGGYGNAVNVNMPNFSVGDIYVNGIDIGGFSSYFAYLNVSSYSGPVFFGGRILGGVAPGFTFAGAAPGDNVQVNLLWGAARFSGAPSVLNMALPASSQFETKAFDPSNTTATGMFLNASSAANGAGTYGGGMEYGRPGSTRRGGAVVVKQDGPSLGDTGLAFFVGFGTSSTDALWEAATLDHNGNFSVSGALSKGSGTFKIDHPLDPENKHLIHGFIEGPRYDLIYRGTATLVNGRATVDIDAVSNMTADTFSALTQNAEVVALNNTGSFARVKSTSIVGGQFDIICEDESSSNEVTWVVMAERSDRFIREKDPWTGEDGRLIPEWTKT